MVVLAADGAPAVFMVIFEAKGIEVHGEEAHDNECQSVHFVRLKCKNLLIKGGG